MVVNYNIVNEMLNMSYRIRTNAFHQIEKKDPKNAPPEIDNLKTDINIDSCHHSIQEDQKRFELKRSVERDHKTFTKNCEDQPRENFFLRY